MYIIIKEEVRLLCLYRVETCQTTLRTEFSTHSVNQMLQLKRPVATTRSSAHRKLEGCGVHTQSAGSLRVHGCTLSPKLPVHLDAFIPANHEDLLFDSTIRLHAYICNCSSTVHFDTFIPTNRYGLPVDFATALQICPSVHPDIPIQFNLPFRQNMHSYLSTHLLAYVPRDVPETKSTCLS